jgi:hypothetical protein
MPNTYTELLKTTVGTATSSVTLSLSGISGYTDLVVVASTLTGNDLADFTLRFNSDSGSNYSTTSLEGGGTSAVSQRQSNQTQMYFVGFQSGTYTEPFTSILQIMNYSNTTTNKTVLTRSSSNAASAYVGLWRSTAAITSVTIYSASSTFSVGSTFSLYGIANADLGSAKATGGIITEDANYWYHTFGASGAFIPKQSLTCDVLVVAGGGGGGDSGGGGAGGLLGFASQSLTAISHTVTVGAGGAGGANDQAGNLGSDSQFASLTLVKGGGRGRGYALTTTGDGGSGGGGSGNHANSQSGGSPTSGQGNSGGNGTATFIGGGGGGAGGAGNAGSGASATGGIGSSAYSSWGLVTGTGQNVSGTVYYAGGGGAGGSQSAGTNNTAGGLGGGGTGNATNASGLKNAIANTGGGGGGADGSGEGGGAGGSGLVIVRYSK